MNAFTENISNSSGVSTAPDCASSLMTPEQVAAVFSVAKRTVLKWAREGKLQGIKVSKKTIRFTREEVNSFARIGYLGIESGTSQNSKRKWVPDLSTTKRKGGSRALRKSSWRSLREEVTKWQ